MLFCFYRRKTIRIRNPPINNIGEITIQENEACINKKRIVGNYIRLNTDSGKDFIKALKMGICDVNK